jgi:hypothetical protein
LIGVVATAALSSPSWADDDATAYRNLATATDYRVRVLAALALGKSHSPGARPALEKALGDVHPSVRAAAGAALGALGDARALRTLKAALANETEVNVRQQYEKSIKQLGQGAPANAAKAKYLVALGKLENKSPVTAPAIASAIKELTRVRMSQVPGVEVVADGKDVGAEGKSRGLPAFQLDGFLTQLVKRQDGDDIGFAARVEYMIRRMPDQALKGTVAGSALASASAGELKGPRETTQLQLDSMTAAIDAALKSVSPALEAAGR